MNEDWLYLDYNASTPMAESVVDVMADCLACQGHPSSSHPPGKLAAAAVEKARRQVAQTLGAQSSEIVFGSGSTEAANQVIKGVAFSAPPGISLHFVSSRVDHAATLAPLEFLKRFGHRVTLLSVNRKGRIDVRELEQALAEPTALVSLIHGQNEVGTVQPLEEAGALCRERGVLFHVDASQSFGKIPVNVDALKADFLNIAGHKIYGPKGVGALYVRSGRNLEPLLHGGGHEGGRRSGTPAPALAAGLGEACRLVERDGLLSSVAVEVLWEELKSALGERVVRNGDPEHTLPNVLHLTFAGISGKELLERSRIAASTGAACHSAAVSPVLKAMGFDQSEAVGSVRLSCGRHTTPEQARLAAARLAESYAALAAQGIGL